MQTFLRAAVHPWRMCAEIRRLAEERGALQHVTRLVAQGASPSVIFNAAAYAVGWLAKADCTVVMRFEADHTTSVVTYWCAPGSLNDISVPFGGRWPVAEDPLAAALWRSHKPVWRVNETVQGEIGNWVRAHGIGSSVACPIIVDDHLWGSMIAMYLGPKPPPDDTEERMRDFVELLNCAITQAQTRAELIACRARLVTTADATRHRIERDLHDGAQQHVISLALKLREAEAGLPPGQQGLKRQLSDTVQGLSNVLTELQEISRGLHPPALARRGVKAVLETLVSRSPVPIDLNIDADQPLSEDLQVSVYYIVSEAITNVYKHAHASEVQIDLGLHPTAPRVGIQRSGASTGMAPLYGIAGRQGGARSVR
jgi:signal transduction histidine kinase